MNASLLEQDHLVDVGLADLGAPQEEDHPHLDECSHDERHRCCVVTRGQLSISILLASEALAASKQLQMSNLASYLKPATLITLVLLCILLLTAMLVALEAMAASKWPQRSLVASDLNSVTSNSLYVSLLEHPANDPNIRSSG